MTASALSTFAVSTHTRRHDTSLLLLALPLIGAGYLLAGIALILGGDDRALFLALGGIPLVAVSVPLVERRHRRLGMWTFPLISVTIGYPVRLTYVYLNNPSKTTIDRFFLLHEPPEYFLWPTLLVSFGLFLMAIAFMSSSGPAREFRLNSLSFGQISMQRIYVVTGLFALISLASTMVFIQGTGGLDLERLSAKRTTINTIDVANDADLQTFGEFRYFANLGSVGYLFLVAALLSSGRKLRRWEVTYLVFYLCIVLFLPFYSSNRADVLAPLLSTFMLMAYLGRRLDWRRVLPIVLVGLMIFNVMSSSRADGRVEIESVFSAEILDDLVDGTVLSRHFTDFSKSSHLIQQVPAKLEYANGKTIASFIIGPIPRSLWPSKPLISSGPVIGQRIYDQRVGTGAFSTSGVPPGLFGELWWNFGLAGIVVGPPLVGSLLGWMNRWAANQTDLRAAVLFSLGLFTFPNGLLSVGFGFAMLGLFTIGAGVQLIYLMLGRPGHKYATSIETTARTEREFAEV